MRLTLFIPGTPPCQGQLLASGVSGISTGGPGRKYRGHSWHPDLGWRGRNGLLHFYSQCLYLKSKISHKTCTTHVIHNSSVFLECLVIKYFSKNLFVS
jgi:hypothetical protein